MTAVFQDIEFGSHPEFSKIRASKVLRDLERHAQNRNKIREKTKVWEEDWGAYKEIHWDPVEAVGLRINWSGYAGLTRSIFSARALTGSRIPWDHGQDGYCFCPAGGRFPVGRVIDGKFERSWQASYLGKETEPLA